MAKQRTLIQAVYHILGPGGGGQSVYDPHLGYAVDPGGQAAKVDVAAVYEFVRSEIDDGALRIALRERFGVSRDDAERILEARRKHGDRG